MNISMLLFCHSTRQVAILIQERVCFMSHFDVFNGDADGICALIQLRQHNPLDSTRITGVKRDISLLQRVNAQSGDQITVLDVSLDKNRDALLNVLQQGAQVQYFDHHFAGEIPDHPGLTAHIDTSPTTCTSLLVDAFLQGQCRAWAVTAAFGDNFHDSAIAAAETLSLSEQQLDQLQELGTYINYNGYGSDLSDLHFEPDQLYQLMLPYTNPLDFIAADPSFKQLQSGYIDDMQKAEALKAEHLQTGSAVFVLPNAAWARRVSGVYGNALARKYPQRAHALLTHKAQGGYLISVRAPLANRTGADILCRQFETGGGRAAAAGVNHLAEHDFDTFVNRFQEAYPG